MDSQAAPCTERGLSAGEISDLLEMSPVPIEGGRYSRTWADSNSTGIYFLITPEDFSGLHVLPSMELWSFHSGSPARMLLLHPDGRVEEPVLGPDLSAGQRPQIVVQPGIVMAAEPLGEWTLAGMFMAPPFDEANVNFVEFPSEQVLSTRYPAAEARIRRLARNP